jgi:hypothetical protein
MSKKLKKLLWIPRVILLINLAIFAYFALQSPGEYYELIPRAIELILLSVLFSITFISAPLSGTIYILVSFFETWTLGPGLSWLFEVFGLYYSMILAGLLLLLLPYFDKQKNDCST